MKLTIVTKGTSSAIYVDSNTIKSFPENSLLQVKKDSRGNTYISYVILDLSGNIISNPTDQLKTIESLSDTIPDFLPQIGIYEGEYYLAMSKTVLPYWCKIITVVPKPVTIDEIRMES